MFIGYKMHPGGTSIVLKKRGGLFEQVLHLVEKRYVDTINNDQLHAAGVQAMLEELDPYSSYIAASDFEEVNQPLEGNFEGVGIEFYRLNDTILVVTAISGGPAEAVGIRAGDKIIAVEGESVTGPQFTNDDVIKRLRGPKGSKVKVKVVRNGQPKTFDFNITRGKIPIYSVDVAYLPQAETGYIKVNKFSATTAGEFNEAVKKLGNIQQLILDLRGNPGGYLDAAISMSDEFLRDQQLITYTEGRAQSRRDYVASKAGKLENVQLVVLIDEGSASASEIVAGAIQDQDRGTLVGRRSFGKGLVQEQFGLTDGSAVRLTVARYYTPSGRSIQKPYEKSRSEGLIERYEQGELFSADSIPVNDSLAYKTRNGRTVYGGGGIIPDIFVPADTSRFSPLVNALFNSGLLVEFSYTLADTDRKEKARYNNAAAFVANYQLENSHLNQLLQKAKAEKIEIPAQIDPKELQEIKRYLKAYIGRQWFGNEAFYPVINQDDNTFQQALQFLNKQ